MKKESLEEANKKIIEALVDSYIETLDKCELMLNISHFLEHYDESVKILMKTNKNNKFKK